MKPHQKKALISFLLFCIIISRDILVGDFKLIPARGRLNMLLSYFFILPCFILGLTFALQYLWQKYIKKKYPGEGLPDWGTFLCLPMIAYFIVVVLMFVVGVMRIYFFRPDY